MIALDFLQISCSLLRFATLSLNYVRDPRPDNLKHLRSRHHADVTPLVAGHKAPAGGC
jgi:hypothetical protein